MNILIYFGNQLNPCKGGTERVACLIADFMIQQGHEVSYMASSKTFGTHSRESSFLPDDTDGPSPQNIAFVNEYISTNHIDVVINEGASTDSVFLFSHEHIHRDTKIISHLHFNVRGDIDSFYKSQYLPVFQLHPKKVFTNLLKRIKLPYNRWRSMRDKRMRYSYMHRYSDYIIVLSKKQKALLNELLGFDSSDKIVDFVNPLTYEVKPSDTISPKQKMIVFVGRLEYSTKRVDRVLRVWHKIHRQLSDWQLKIIGSGDDETRLKLLSKKLTLENIEFLGHTDAEPYYKDASILLLTSNHEGTPMVIPEAMAFGVVPIVMDNFSDVDMFISKAVTGLVTKPFDIDDMADKILMLAGNQQQLKEMSKAAFEKIKTIENSRFLEPWKNLIDEGQHSCV